MLSRSTARSLSGLGAADLAGEGPTGRAAAAILAAIAACTSSRSGRARSLKPSVACTSENLFTTKRTHASRSSAAPWRSASVST